MFFHVTSHVMCLPFLPLGQSSANAGSEQLAWPSDTLPGNGVRKCACVYVSYRRTLAGQPPQKGST